ncbi:hypothetical protein Trydic_g239 [Trypoxylus dichotomus]
MLCPETWNFKAPASDFKFEKSDISTQSCRGKINNFYFNHLVSLTVPDTLNIPKSLTDTLLVDCEYYKVCNLDPSEFVNATFINSFVNSGALTLLSGLKGLFRIFVSTININITMPRHCEVPTLEKLSLKAIGSVVTALSPSILASINIHCEPQLTLQRKLDCLGKVLASHVPFYLYDRMAHHVLNAVKALIEKTKKNYFPRVSMNMFMTEMNVVVSLTEVVLNHHLKHIDFSQWPKIMRYVLYKNLVKMTGLEVLNLGSCTGGWRTREHDKFIHHGIMGMKNLRSLCLCFDCTDNVIQILGDNCCNLQSLDVTSSGSVTDRCIPSLLKCGKLQELQLHRTSITVVGYAQLLMGLDRLQDIGRCDEIGNVVRYIHLNYPDVCYLGLKKFQTRDLTTENLRLLVVMCPRMESISLFHDEQFSDLTVLTALDNLKDIKLLSCNFYTDYLKQLLEIKGCNLTSLHLEHVEEIDLNALISLSKYCPRIKNLVLYNCDFLDQVAPANRNRYNVKPFECLERIFWVVDCAITHLEFLLMHAINVRFIHLGSSTGITHSSISRILGINPMKKLEELRILYSSDMSLRTIELLIASCPNLRVLSELESWQGLSVDELKAFRESIVFVKIDLSNLTHGTKIFERTRNCLKRLNAVDVIVTWEPQEAKICPSSIAKYFDDLNYDVRLCAPKYDTQVRYSVKAPIIDFENCDQHDCAEYMEWLGMLVLNGDIENGSQVDFVNTYEVLEPNVTIGQVRIAVWRGFFTCKRLEMFFNKMMEYQKDNDKPWISLHVQGFSDSPINWGEREHHFYTNGDNSYTIFANSKKSITCSHMCSYKRYKKKQK